MNISKQDKQYMELDFSGEGHTLLNLLQSSLLKDNNVEMAGYVKPHPLMDRSRLFITLKKGDNHLKVLKEAIKNTKKDLDEFKNKIEESYSNLKT